MGSRVVPGVAETIDTSRRAIAFISVDLPTLGGPAMTTLNPSRSRSPERAEARLRPIRSTAAAASRRTRARPAGSTSSWSEKSICASTSAIASTISARIASASRVSAPPAIRSAWRRCASVCASTRSASPSTCDRSSLPFSKARSANSPGSAGRRPSRCVSASITPARTARPPVTCSSAMSSPV